MVFFYHSYMIVLWIQIFQVNIIQSSYVRYLSYQNAINHLTYYSPLKWFYVASINSLSIYDENLVLLQNISIQNSFSNHVDICQINPCQCLNNLTKNSLQSDDSTTSRIRRSNSNSTLKFFDQENSNLILYLEIDHQIRNKPYLIDCWSLQTGSCIIRNALNLSDIYYQHFLTNEKSSLQKFLLNTDSTIPSHIFPFHFKYNKCNQTPTYLFLTSTLKRNFILPNQREKFDDLIDQYSLQCLEQAQRRTIALRTLIFNDQRTKSLITPINSSNITIVRDSIMKRQVIENFINRTRSTSTNNNKSHAILNMSSILPLSSTISNDHVIRANNNNRNNNTSSPINFISDQGPFLNINDYCPEQLSVVRSIYTDFFERESSEKFRIFQDIIYDQFDSAIYVFTNQQYASKIIRLCEGQISFRHYVEIQINCGNDYTLIQKVKLIQFTNNKQYLLTIASKSKTSQSLEPSNNSHSAICLYDFDQIRNAFIDNIIDLSKGNISLGMAWLHGESVIPQYPAPYGNLARCSTTRDASYLMIYEGPKTIVSQPIITFPFDQLTSLEATLVNNYIVVLTGTADGKIKKISIETEKQTTIQFEEVFIHFGEAILRDMILDENKRFLYGATKTRLFQVDLHDCDRHKTCSTCLSSQNPYCGWATTINRCTIRTNLTNNLQRFHWLQIHDNCPHILDITPAFLSKSKSTHLHLKVDSIPDDPISNYSCSFGLTRFVTEIEIYKSNAIKNETSIRCYSPSSELLANITQNSIILHVLYNDIILAEKNLTFYDCSSYLTCTSCMNNTFNCTWKLLTSTCVDSDLVVEQIETLIRNSSLNQCPRYNVSMKEIFIADNQSFILGSENRVMIRTMSIQFRIQKYFRCILTFNNGSRITTMGKIYNNLLICEPFRISYEKDVGQQQLSFDIEWRECENECTYKSLETLSNLTVNIYKCKYLADSCGSCILFSDNYHCFWCETDKSCRHEINSSICKPNHIISSSMGICPNPRLRQIYPKIGPQYGQTPLQIYGSSLGKHPDDISVVLINSNQTAYPCHIQKQSYIIAQSFLCLPPSLPIGIYTIKVTVHSVVSKDRPIFQIVKPIIKDIYPSLGPKSGGTLLSIKGKHLTIGNEIRIFVGQQQCVLIENEIPLISSTLIDDEINSMNDLSLTQIDLKNENENEIVQCRTSKLAEQNSNQQIKFVKRQALWTGTITILIDNFTETYSNLTYSYTEDPRVDYLSRYSGIQTGGLPFVVHGTNFDSIQTPQFFLETSQNRLIIENCSVKTSSLLLCLGPSFQWIQNETFINSTDIHIRSSMKFHCLEFQFGFLMDNVESLRNTSTYSQTFLLCPDPIIYPFHNDGKRIQYRYDYLTIEGLYLLDVATIDDYFITIGSYPCNITSISDKQIVCQPTNHTIEKLSRKKRSLLDINSKDHDQAIVRVTLGRRIYTLGTLTYTSNNEKRSLLLYYILASICGFLLTISIIIISILFRRINTKRTRQLHRLQNQIDTLEMRVARECKEAFAELQTDIGEMTNDLSHSGVPYHDYQTFCMKILFPNANDEEKYLMLHQIEIPIESARRNHTRQGLQLLSQSLYNRHFLLLIIRTLEMDKINFRLQDRMKFASLLSILFQDNIEYLTEILKILLRDLIEKTVQQDRNNSKILLRSNASIAEKMLANWFAFLLFDYIKERLGSPLYILFQSIKQQIQKGPIDCFTNESRYSLSEDKLLRQHVDYSSMIVYVLQIDDDKSHLMTTPVPIKVLSCDSITQVKEKIVDHFYKNIPFSKRPTIDEFDLEWRIGSHMKLLRDDDKSENPDSNGFIQVQTLASYKIHDGARLFLSLKRGINHTNTSSTISSNSMTKSHLSFMKTIDIDQNWQLCQGAENQILLNSTIDLSTLKKDQRSSSSDQTVSNTRLYHLIKSTDREDDDDRTLGINKLVSEVYLTRLLATKGSLQQYIDNFFDTIFCLTDIPSPIKYFFDFLDEQAEYYQIFDSNIVHTWKSNSLPLRFFVNIIKNPDFIFDVQKTNVIDASLSVIAQMFMDSCAAGTHQLTKDSPSSKLLFYRDVQKYKKLVEKYYDAISSLPTVPTTELDRNIVLIKEHEQLNNCSSKQQTNEFNRTYILYKLYDEYLSRYKNSLRIAMTNDFYGKQYRLAALFEQIVNSMESFEVQV